MSELGASLSRRRPRRWCWCTIHPRNRQYLERTQFNSRHALHSEIYRRKEDGWARGEPAICTRTENRATYKQFNVLIIINIIAVTCILLLIAFFCTFVCMSLSNSLPLHSDAGAFRLGWPQYALQQWSSSSSSSSPNSNARNHTMWRGSYKNCN